MDEVIRKCYRGIAYCYYNPKDDKSLKLLNSFLDKAWHMGYPRGYFDNPSKLTNDIVIEDMTEWELRYVIR